jgi:hypothetical protein
MGDLIDKKLLRSFHQRNFFDKIIIKKNNDNQNKYGFFFINNKGEEKPLCEHSHNLSSIYDYIYNKSEKKNINKKQIHLKSICSQCQKKIKINSFNHTRFVSIFNKEVTDKLEAKEAKEVIINETNILTLKFEDFIKIFREMTREDINDNDNDLNSKKNEGCKYLLKLMPSTIQIHMLYAIKNGLINNLTEGFAYWIFFLLKIFYSKTLFNFMKNRENGEIKNPISSIANLSYMIQVEYGLLSNIFGIKERNYRSLEWNFFYFINKKEGNCVLYTVLDYFVIKMLDPSLDIRIVAWMGHMNLGYFNSDFYNNELFIKNWATSNLAFRPETGELCIKVNIDQQVKDQINPSNKPININVIGKPENSQFIFNKLNQLYKLLNNYKNEIETIEATIEIVKEHVGNEEKLKKYEEKIKKNNELLLKTQTEYEKVLELLKREFCFIIFETVSRNITTTIYSLNYYAYLKRQKDKKYLQHISLSKQDMFINSITSVFHRERLKLNEFDQEDKKKILKREDFDNIEYILKNSTRDVWDLQDEYNQKNALIKFWDYYHEEYKRDIEIYFRDLFFNQFFGELEFNSTPYILVLIALYIINIKWENKKQFIERTHKAFKYIKYGIVKQYQEYIDLQIKFNADYSVYSYMKGTKKSPNYTFKFRQPEPRQKEEDKGVMYKAWEVLFGKEEQKKKNDKEEQEESSEDSSEYSEDSKEY